MDKNELDNDELLGFIKRNYMKNRTFVTKDIPSILDDIEAVTDLEVIRHRYLTGDDCATWLIPPQWDVVEAWIKDSDGNILGSYDDHPLFLCTYSCSTHQKLTKEELLPHITVEPKQPDAYAYNWRYASDFNLRLKDWGISLPENVVKNMGDGPFEIFIDVDVKDSEMLVGEICIPGESDETFIFLSDFCHPGQVNDSFSGLAMFMKLMYYIARMPSRKYTYKLLIMPETIGSAAYISTQQESLKNVRGAMFSEMVGWGEEWYLKKSRKSDTYMNLLARECARKFTDLTLSDFFSLIGNDEYMFDSVQSGIPTLSLQKYPFDQYHTSNDEPSHFNMVDFSRAYDISVHMVNTIELDKRYEFVHSTPFWMTRYNLYSDDQYEPEDFQKRFKIIYQLLDGMNSNLEIADLLDCSLEEINPFLESVAENKLVKELPMHFKNV